MICRTGTLLGVCAAGALIGAAALAQPSDTKPKPKPTDAPKAPAHEPGKADPGAGMTDDMKKAMDAWMASGTPGKMHEHLTVNAGTWDGTVKMWMMPGAPPSESKCVTKIESMMGGRFTHSTTEGMMDMGMGGPQKFEGFGLYGYNNTSEKFESVWADNMGTLIQFYTGKLSADGKTLTWECKFMDPATKKETWMRLEETMTGPDVMTMKMYGPDMTGKEKEAKTMEIDYKRRAGTAPKPEAKHEPKPMKPEIPKPPATK